MPSLRAPARLSPLRVFDESDFAFIAGIAREQLQGDRTATISRLFT